jgi:phytoene desaturase
MVRTMPDVVDDTLGDAVQDRLLPDLRDDTQVLHVVNPADSQRQGMLAGTPSSLAHTFAQAGPFRPANTVRGIDNAVLAGSSTVPGVGVPTAVITGRLAADRITGQSATSLNLKAGLP